MESPLHIWRRVFSFLVVSAAWFAVSTILAFGPCVIVHAWDSDSSSQGKRAVTVADGVAMATLESPADIYAGSPIPQFSPDGKHFVVVVRRANVEENTNDASVLLYHTADVFDSPKPDVLVKMSSPSSDRYAIRQIRWLADSETLVFLGENSGECSQIYELDIRTRYLRKQTSHPTAITNYDITLDGSAIAYLAEPPEPWPAPKEQESAEVVITGQDLGNILAGHHFQPAGQQAFWMSSDGRSQAIPVAAGYFVPETKMSWSSTGRYLVFPALVRDLQFRREWEGYNDPLVKQVFAAHAFKARISPLQQYLLFDTTNGSLAPLLDAPVINAFDRFSWAKDGQSVFLSSYLPLSGSDAEERRAREQNKYVLQVTLPGREYRKVRNEDSPAGEAPILKVDLTVDQDLNTPPKIYVAGSSGQHKTLLLDLNPQFSHLEFGAVRTIEWNVDGVAVIGGLYLPPEYVPGKHYPLVIQTHGFVPSEFSMDGRSEWSSGFAARPLAAKGILVLQTWTLKDQRDYERISTDRQLGGTSEEAILKFNALAYERAIDRLDDDGMIDRNRVGIIGFSRTACFVGYTLTHSHYQFAAAMLVDGISCGYFEEIAAPEESRDINFVNGGVAPFGGGLSLWMKNSPGFNLNEVRTPVQLVSLGDYSVLMAWEWYVSLSLQNKPVDFVLVPNGYHIGVRPSQRMLTQQGIVDWFNFWLRDEEDPDPAKANQYARWRELRKLQQVNEKR